VSGPLAGGAIDHLIVVALGRPTTPYGVRAGVRRNLALGLLDAVLAWQLLELARRNVRARDRGARDRDGRD
jgi:hypothetical protein